MVPNKRLCATELDSKLMSQSLDLWHRSAPVHHGMPFAVTLIFVLLACCLGFVAFGK